MVGSLVLMKLLHCRRLRHGKCKNKNTEDSVIAHHSKVKKEPNALEDYTCRVCLKEGNIPLYGDDGRTDIVESLNMFGGIEVQIDDIFPKYLCEPCHSLLEGAILFRKTAQQSEQTLKEATEHNLNFNNDSDHNYDDTEHKVEVKPNYHCRRCNLDFNLFQDYNEHKASIEHENMKIRCPICCNLYSESYLKKHLLLHKPEDVPFVCDICGKKFIMQGQFTRHRLTHFYDLPFKCSLCPYRGRFTESLKMHMRTHTGDKPYQCSECAKCFISKSNLNKHMHVHKAEHDFKCETCGRGFNTKRTLDLHFKVDHTGIKDHLCNICGKAFGYRKQMMKHQLKVHKREKMRTGRMPLYLQVESLEKNRREAPISDNVVM
ncbi:zinc finger protein 92-like [Cydia strobilella]|uniref:zinc finger protein 92-like n=1 Tax=Cydia strobilella TaxID=1100964 RepID=UPI003005AEE2